MIRSFAAVLSLLLGALMGAMFFIVENNLMQGSLSPDAFIIPAVSGGFIFFIIYVCYVLVGRTKEIESNLEFHDSMLKSITDTAPIGIALLCNREFVHVNEYLCRMLGYKPEELLGMNSRMIYFNTDDYEAAGRVQIEQINERGTASFETRLRCKDGSVKHVIFSTGPLDPEDWYKGVTCTVLDISKRKNVENELQKSYEELERRKDAYKEAHRLERLANIERSNFQDNMNHEIRTPLNGIMGMLQILQYNLKNEENLESVNDALKSCHRLANLLNDILTISRIEAGKSRIRNNPFDLRDILELTGSLFIPAAEQKGLRYHVDISDSLPQILLGDEKKIEQVLNNVVGNAVKFTESGEIHIEAYPLPSVPERYRVFFSVSDTGIGIADEAIQHIFNPYSQVDGSNTRSYDGAGLGLAIVKKLVNAMGGNMAIASEPGKGTSIYFCLEFRLPSPGIDY